MMDKAETPRSEGCVSIERADGVCYVTLRSPSKRNAMSRAMWRELRAGFEAIQADNSLRCVVLQGAVGQFCAGGDIAEYPSFRFNDGHLAHFHEVEVWGALAAILHCDVPVLAAIEGACMGAGVEIAACCDIRLADPQARFGAPIGRLGFPMAPREAALLNQVLGPTVARAMLLAGTLYGADQLQQSGFLTQLAEPGNLSDLLAASVASVLQLAPQAARQNKQTLRALSGLSTSSELPSLATVTQTYRFADTPEHREGVMAFIEKRPPAF